MKYAKTAYPVPRAIPPGMSIDAHLEPLLDFAAWLREFGIPTANTRLERYIRYFESFQRRGGLPERAFTDPPEHPFRSPADRFLYVVREVHELNWIYLGLAMKPPKGVEGKLKSIVGGTDFAALDRRTESRDTQFELRVASYFCRLKYAVDLSTNTDIIARSLGLTFWIECKRVASKRLVDRRLKEAIAQLAARMPTRSGHFGVVALDVTKVAFRHNGLTAGVTAEHSRDVVRDEIVKISDAMLEGSSIFSRRENLLMWTQVHIPSLVNQPVQVLTHFSSRFISNPSMTKEGTKAFGRLQRVLEASRYDRSADVAPRTLRPRTVAELPQGTQFVSDELTFGLFLVSGILPPAAPDKIVLTATGINGSDEFTYEELRIVVERLAEVDRDQLRISMEAAVTGLAARLLIQRYPYEDTYGEPQFSIPPSLLTAE